MLFVALTLEQGKKINPSPLKKLKGYNYFTLVWLSNKDDFPHDPWLFLIKLKCKKCLPSSELATKETTQDLVLLNNYNNVGHFHTIMRLHTFPSYISASHISFTIDISNTCYAYYLEQDSCFYYCLVQSRKVILFCLRQVQSLRDPAAQHA